MRRSSPIYRLLSLLHTKSFEVIVMSELIVICSNPFRDIGLELTLKAKRILLDRGYGVKLCLVFGENDPDAVPQGIEITPWSELEDNVKLFIVIGGDGTILHTARYLNHTNTPMLGVNLGTKGFMASLEPEDIALIADAADGKYLPSVRMMLDVRLIRDGECVFSDCALNDVVIHGRGDCIKVTAWCDGDRVVSFSGDGIIVSTPTGSTGYSMSAGGPIVEPEAKNLIISPICAHVMGAKTFVLGPERTVTVKPQKIHDRRAFVSVDGNDGIELKNDDVIIVCQSNKTANLVHMGLKSFYDSTFDKLLYKN